MGLNKFPVINICLLLLIGIIFLSVVVSADNKVFTNVNHMNNSIYNVSNITAGKFFGDGSGLTGITGSTDYVFINTNILANNTDSFRNITAFGNTTYIKVNNATIGNAIPLWYNHTTFANTYTNTVNNSLATFIANTYLTIANMFTKNEIVNMLSGNLTTAKTYSNDILQGNLSSNVSKIYQNINISDKILYDNVTNYINTNVTNLGQRINISDTILYNNLTTNNTASYVPYDGANKNSDLGTWNLTASWLKGTFGWIVNSSSSTYLNFNGTNLALTTEVTKWLYNQTSAGSTDYTYINANILANGTDLYNNITSYTNANLTNFGQRINVSDTILYNNLTAYVNANVTNTQQRINISDTILYNNITAYTNANLTNFGTRINISDTILYNNITTNNTETYVSYVGGLKNIVLGVWNLTTTGWLSGTLSWSNLSDFPSACPAGSAITQLGTSITCTSFPTHSYVNDVSNGNLSAGKIYTNSVLQGNLTANITNVYSNINISATTLYNNLTTNNTASYVPYVGASKNVNISTWNITGTNFSLGNNLSCGELILGGIRIIGC